MGKGENITIDVLGEICAVLDCSLNDNMEFIPDKPKEANSKRGYYRLLIAGLFDVGAITKLSLMRFTQKLFGGGNEFCGDRGEQHYRDKPGWEHDHQQQNRSDRLFQRVTDESRCDDRRGEYGVDPE